ncbi:MAG: MerR family transcriptional regulator [Thermoanaerobaculia bacterium]
MLARLAGVGVETVRFYEREGLLQEPPRRESGYREYPPESLVRLRFIRHTKALGFSLPEIQELLSLRYSENPCEGVQQRIKAKIENVRQKIRSLQKIETMLEELAANCIPVSGPGECPALDVLERPEEKEERYALSPAKRWGNS